MSKTADELVLIPGPYITPGVRKGTRWVTPEFASYNGSLILARRPHLAGSVVSQARGDK